MRVKETRLPLEENVRLLKKDLEAQQKKQKDVIADIKQDYEKAVNKLQEALSQRDDVIADQKKTLDQLAGGLAEANKSYKNLELKNQEMQEEVKKLERSISGKIVDAKKPLEQRIQELGQELFKQKGKTVDKKEFERIFEKHQKLSRKSSAKMFKGGLADHSEEVTKLHTATHLLQAALRKALRKEVFHAAHLSQLKYIF